MHEADVPDPESVQGDPENWPVTLEVKLTVPDGVLVAPLVVSVTVTVQVTATPSVPVDGQLTVVEVAILLSTVTEVLPELLSWPESP